MQCPKCKQENKNGDKFCINCGYPLPEQEVMIHSSTAKKAWYKRWWIWALMGAGSTALLFISTCTCTFMLPDSLRSTPDSASYVQTTAAPKEENTETPTTAKLTEAPTEIITETPTEMDAEDIVKTIVDGGFEEVSIETLDNNYDKYDGKKIVTAVQVTSASFSIVHADGFKFSFDKSSDRGNAEKGDYIIVFGTCNGKGLFTDEKEINHCFVAIKGEQAQIEFDKLKRQAIDDSKKQQSEAAEKAKNEEKEFKESCKTIDYATLSRNPDKYKGDYLKYTGKVIQVVESDSLFGGSTALRINVTQNESEYLSDFWDDTIYCTVEIPEGADRILEDDIVTFYGECEGLYSYTAVLGQKISLPRISIKYYELEE